MPIWFRWRPDSSTTAPCPWNWSKRSSRRPGLKKIRPGKHCNTARALATRRCGPLCSSEPVPPTAAQGQGWHADVEQVVLTAGSNQLLYLVADVLLDPGDIVLCHAELLRIPGNVSQPGGPGGGRCNRRTRGDPRGRGRRTPAIGANRRLAAGKSDLCDDVLRQSYRGNDAGRAAGGAGGNGPALVARVAAIRDRGCRLSGAAVLRAGSAHAAIVRSPGKHGNSCRHVLQVVLAGAPRGVGNLAAGAAGATVDGKRKHRFWLPQLQSAVDGPNTRFSAVRSTRSPALHTVPGKAGGAAGGG